MDGRGIKISVLSGLFWKAMENGGDQLVTFVISVVLARLLGPEKYGLMATMLIFIAIANVIIQNGFQTALIQKKNIDTYDLSSVFWVGLIISSVLYAVIFLAAPYIAAFFGDEEIVPMLRVLAVILFFGAVTSVEIAIAARDMNFRVQCVCTISADVLSGILGIFAAFKGLGTWALVMQQLSKNFFLMVFMYVRLGWRPAGIISPAHIRELFDYGWKVLASGLIDTLYNNIYTPIISKLYNTAMVGYYNRGNQFPLVIVNSMASTVQAVMLPAFSRIQDEKEKAKSMMRRAVKMSSFIMFPALLGVAATADSIIMLLLGSEWMPAVPLLRLSAFSYCVWHIHVVNLQAINANGRSDIYLKLEIIKKAAGMAVLIASIRLGITGMLFMKALFDFICTFINAWPNNKIMGYGPFAQWRDVMPEFLLSLSMFAVVMVTQTVFLRVSPSGAEGGIPGLGGANLITLLFLQIGMGVVFYMGVAFLAGMESPRYILETAALFLRGDASGGTPHGENGEN